MGVYENTVLVHVPVIFTNNCNYAVYAVLIASMQCVFSSVNGGHMKIQF